MFKLFYLFCRFLSRLDFFFDKLLRKLYDLHFNFREWFPKFVDKYVNYFAEKSEKKGGDYNGEA